MISREERARALARARHARYNASPKGKARYRRYEEKHPERKTRWSVLLAFRNQNPPPM